MTKSSNLAADRIVEGKKLGNAAKVAADESDRRETVAHRQWDAIITGYWRSMWLPDGSLKRTCGLNARGEAGVTARDAAALKAAKGLVASEALADDVLRGRLLLKRSNEVLSKYDLDAFGKALVEEMAKDKAKTVVEYDKRAQALGQEVKKIQDAAARPEIAPPDGVWATALPGFEANLMSKAEAPRSSSTSPGLPRRSRRSPGRAASRPPGRNWSRS
jgi:hypothetical protein